MIDSRQAECLTAEDIAQAKINAIKVRDGDPSRDEVLRVVLEKLQAHFQVRTESAAVVDAYGTSPTADPKGMTALVRNESLEALGDVERACLEAMKQHVLDHGIVCVDENTNKEAYQSALKENKIAAKDWERDLQPRLLANDGALLKKCVELSKLTGFMRMVKMLSYLEYTKTVSLLSVKEAKKL